MSSENRNTELDVFEGYGLRCNLPTPDKFLVVMETLTRIGIASRNEDGSRKLCQTCHILHKKGQYAIFHFKELYGLDNKETSIDENDILRRNLIAELLESWELIELRDRPPKTGEDVDLKKLKIRILKHSEVDGWTLKPMYSLGSNKRRGNDG